MTPNAERVDGPFRRPNRVGWNYPIVMERDLLENVRERCRETSVEVPPRSALPAVKKRCFLLSGPQQTRATEKTQDRLFDQDNQRGTVEIVICSGNFDARRSFVCRFTMFEASK